jgi:hypothetical protein
MGLLHYFYIPKFVDYGPYQQLWDSSFHMTVWSWSNINNSIFDLQIMLHMLKPTGEVPEMIMYGKDVQNSWQTFEL